MRNVMTSVGVVVCLLLGAAPARALITGGGKEPAADHNWPLGSVAAANLPSRIAWWEGPPFGGGQFVYLYRGDAAAFNAALDALAKVQAPAPGVQLVVEDGPEEDFWLGRDGADGKKADGRVDWRFEIWDPSSWHNLHNNPKSFFLADRPGFRQPVPPPKITVYIGGGGIDWKDVKVPKGVRVTDRRAAAAPGVVKLEGGAVVRGTVYDMTTSKPVVGAHVTVAGPNLRGFNDGGGTDKTLATDSDAQGHFQIEKIPAGTYSLVISAKGYASRTTDYEKYKPTTFRGFDVMLAPSATISGTVVDDAGKPIAGAKVRPAAALSMDGLGYPLPGMHGSPDPFEVKTDQDGRFEVPGLPIGYTVLWCAAPNYYYGKVDALTKAPAKGVTLQMVRTGALKVTLVDAAGQPVTGNVSVEADVKDPEDTIGTWGGGAEVGADGTRLFDGVPPGRYLVSAHFIFITPGQPRDPKAKGIEVTAGKTADVTITKPGK